MTVAGTGRVSQCAWPVHVGRTRAPARAPPELRHRSSRPPEGRADSSIPPRLASRRCRRPVPRSDGLLHRAESLRPWRARPRRTPSRRSAPRRALPAQPGAHAAGARDHRVERDDRCTPLARNELMEIGLANGARHPEAAVTRSKAASATQNESVTPRTTAAPVWTTPETRSSVVRRPQCREAMLTTWFPDRRRGRWLPRRPLRPRRRRSREGRAGTAERRRTPS